MNKSELEKLSDFEINRKVASFNGLDCSGITESMASMYSMKDYCNNWSDMGPLIANNINMIVSLNGTMAFSEHEIAFDSEHENPLRAAAIVYLLMQGEK